MQQIAKALFFILDATLKLELCCYGQLAHLRLAKCLLYQCVSSPCIAMLLDEDGAICGSFGEFCIVLNCLWLFLIIEIDTHLASSLNRIAAQYDIYR